VAVVFVAAAVLWIAGDPIRSAIGPRFPALWEGFKLQAKHYEAAVAMLAALSLVVSRTVTAEALRKVPWSTLLLIGGSFAMAAGIEGSGLSAWLSVQIAPIAGLPEPLQFALAAAVTIALSAVASNTATVNVVLNLLPRSLPLLSVSAIASSCDFALPAGTPPNAIVFGSGYIRLPVMMRVGIVLDLLAALALTLYGWLYVRHLF
jgi:solute carrier family 13 (sodium-dependent dicarboxylate transporter), member 2/3/5